MRHAGAVQVRERMLLWSEPDVRTIFCREHPDTCVAQHTHARQSPAVGGRGALILAEGACGEHSVAHALDVSVSDLVGEMLPRESEGEELTPSRHTPEAFDRVLG
jgi:hypothetical protein